MPDVREWPHAYRRVALIGGVYNNYLALEAACRLARANGCEKIFALGDLGGFGPHPDRVFPILDAYEVQSIQGNYEASLAARRDDCGCGYTHPTDNHFAQLSYDYTNRRLSDENRARLAAFPKQLRFRLGRRLVHLCHGSPRRINEFLWETTTSDGFLRLLQRQLGFDVLGCTHTGLPWKREFEPGRWIVNVGVVGRPANDGRTNVWYAELADEAGNLIVEHRPVAYDHARLAREMRDERIPEEFVATIEGGYWTTCLEVLPAKERARGRY